MFLSIHSSYREPYFDIVSHLPARPTLREIKTIRARVRFRAQNDLLCADFKEPINRKLQQCFADAAPLKFRQHEERPNRMIGFCGVGKTDDATIDFAHPTTTERIEIVFAHLARDASGIRQHIHFHGETHNENCVDVDRSGAAKVHGAFDLYNASSERNL
jgi:hypothetical protein